MNESSHTTARVAQAISWLNASDRATRSQGLLLTRDLCDSRLIPHLIHVAVTGPADSQPGRDDVLPVAPAAEATQALRRIIGKLGFTSADRADLLAALYDPRAADGSVIDLWVALGSWTAALVTLGLNDSSSVARARAVAIAARLLDPDLPAAYLADRSALVRLAAIRCLDVRRGIETQSRLQGLLEDPVLAVREAAAERLRQA